MPKFTFLGSNASGYDERGGLRFETGKAVEVKDSEENKALIDLLSKNQEYKSAGKKAEDMIDPESLPEPVLEGEKFDHDGDGKVGGSKPKLGLKK